MDARPIPRFKYVFSYIVPVRIASGSSDYHSKLHLELYRGQLTLSTASALYSVGDNYAPFKIGFQAIRNMLPNVDSFLLLGTGLGSALYILQKKYLIYPHACLIDLDSEILRLSRQWMHLNTKGNTEWVCADAKSFMAVNNCKYDLIGIDLFHDLYHPEWACEEPFINQCHAALNPNGIILANYIFRDNYKKTYTIERYERIFRKVEVIPYRQNLIVLAFA